MTLLRHNPFKVLVLVKRYALLHIMWLWLFNAAASVFYDACDCLMILSQ
jgi:hypothetical protein